MEPDTNANCILTSGIFDAYCLLCDTHLEDSGQIKYHVLFNMEHRKKMEQVEYMYEYEGDRISQVNHGYYCQFCNILMSTAAKIAFHVAGPTHQHFKQVARLQRLRGNVITGDNVSVGELAWNGLIGDGPGTCAVCDKEYDNALYHMKEPDHVIKLIHSTVQFGPHGMLYRTVDEFSFQCLTCNMIFPLSIMYHHAWDSGHQTLYDNCKTKVTYKTLTIRHIEDNGAPIDQLVDNKILYEYCSKTDKTSVFMFDNIEYITQVDDTHEKYHEVLSTFKKSDRYTENRTPKNNQLDVPSDSANCITDSANGTTDSANGNTDSANGNTDSANGNTDSANGNTDSANGNTDSANGNTDSANGNTDCANNDKTEEETSEAFNKNEVKTSNNKSQFGHIALNNTLLLLDTTTKKLLYFKYDNFTKYEESGRVNSKNEQWLECQRENIKKSKIAKTRKPKKIKAKGSNGTSQLDNTEHVVTHDLATTTRTNLLSSYLCEFTKRENPVSNDGNDGNSCNIVEETPQISESKNNEVANNDQIELPSNSDCFVNKDKINEKTAEAKKCAVDGANNTSQIDHIAYDETLTPSIQTTKEIEHTESDDIIEETTNNLQIELPSDSSDCVNNEKSDERTAKLADDKNEANGSSDPTAKTQFTCEVDIITTSEIAAPVDVKDKKCSDIVGETPTLCKNTKNEDSTNSDCVNKDKTDEKTAKAVIKVGGSNVTSQLDITHPTMTIQEPTTKAQSTCELDKISQSKFPALDDSKDERCCDVLEETSEICATTKIEDSVSSKCVIEDTDEKTAIVVHKNKNDDLDGDRKIAEPVDSKDQKFPNIGEETPKTCVSSKNEDSASGNSDCVISEDKTDEETAIVVDKNENNGSNGNGDSKIAEPVDSKDGRFPNIGEETPKTCVSSKNEDSASGNSDCVISEDKTDEETAIVVDKNENNGLNGNGDSKIAEPVDSKDERFPNIEDETPKTCVSTKNEDSAISEDKTDEITAIIVDKDENDESNGNSQLEETENGNSQQEQATETPLIPKQNTQEMSTQTEDNKKPNIVKIFESIPEFESQGICVNLEMSTVFCTLCTKYLLFEYKFIKKHIKEHELNIVEENLRRSSNGEGNNGFNNNLIYFVNDITVQSLGNRFKRFKQLGKSDWPSLMDEYYNDDILSSILDKSRHSPTYASSPKAKDMMATLININSDVPLKSPLKERNSNVNQSPVEKKPTFKEMESVIQKISDLLDDDLYSVSTKDTNIQISTDTKAPNVNTKLSVRVTNKKKWFVTPDIELPPICKKIKMLKEKENISPTGEINKHMNTLPSEISNMNDVNNKKTLSPKNVTTSLLPKMNNVQSPPVSSKENIQQKYSQYSLKSNGHPSPLPNEAKMLSILKENPPATNETSSEKPATVASNVNMTLHKQYVERLATSRAANDQMMSMNKICRERRIASEYKASMNGPNINVPSRSNLKRSNETEEITHHIPLMLNGISSEDPFTAEQFMDAITVHLNNNRKIVKTSSTSNESDNSSSKDQSVVMQPNPDRICESIALTGNDDKTTLSQRPNEKCLICVTDMNAGDSQQSADELDSETSLSTDSDSSSESIDTTPSSTKSKLSTSNERKGRTRRSSTPIRDARSTSNEKNADAGSSQSDSDSAKSSVKSEDGCADFAAANGLTYNACNRNAYCHVCNARIPSSMKNFREHIAGAIHKSRAAIPPSKRVEKLTLPKQTMAEFVDSKLVVTDCHVDDVVINEKYCLTRLSYYMITKTTAVRHRCHLCEMNVLTSRLDDHLRKQGHDRAVDEVNVVCSPDEMFREIKPEIYHCGYCNQIVGKWDQVLTHVKTSDHKSWKGQALSRIRGYHAAALEDHRNIRERKHKTMVMLGLCE